MFKFYALMVLCFGCMATANGAVKRAIDRWHEATGLDIESPHVIETWGPMKCNSHDEMNGCYNSRTRTIILDVKSDRLEQAAAHEVGHMLGAMHNHDGIMANYGPSAKLCISTKDVASTCDVNTCKFKRPECE